MKSFFNCYTFFMSLAVLTCVCVVCCQMCYNQAVVLDMYLLPVRYVFNASIIARQ